MLGTTTNSFFQQTNQGFGVNQLEGLDSEQLRERLLVAETIMKKLYSRNKELEEFHKDSLKEPAEAKSEVASPVTPLVADQSASDSVVVEELPSIAKAEEAKQGEIG